MNIISLTTIISVTLSAIADEITFQSYRRLGDNPDYTYDNTKIDGLVGIDFSGVTYNPITCSYYMISDECCVENKGFYGIDLNPDLTEMTVLQGIQMEEGIYKDTEGITFLGDADNSYYIVGQEGYREFNTVNSLLLYNTDGTYITSLIDQIPTKFLIDNTDDNKGIEGLAIDDTQEYLVFSTELSLINDRSVCENCVRISVNNVSVDPSADDDADIVTITELYELRYDLDTTDLPAAGVGLSDIVIFKNNEDKLYGLVLERLTFYTLSPLDGSIVEAYDNYIYMVDLTLMDGYDIKDCQSLSDGCQNVTAIEKTLLFTFSDIDTTAIDGFNLYGQLGQFLNFEALTIIYDQDGDYYDDGIINLVAINDNGNETDTFFVFLEYDASSLFNTMSTSLPSTTVVGDEIPYKTIPYGTIEDGLLIQELSGITYNSLDNTYYAVSDEFITNKGFYGFEIGITGDTATLEYGDMIEMENPMIDSEGIIFIKNVYDEDNSFYLVSTEGNTNFDTANRILLYSIANGTFLGELTDQLPDKFLISNTENNRGIEGFSIDETQANIVYTTELPLLSDRALCENCVRISVNTFSVDEYADNGTTITITEDYELRYDIDTFAENTAIPSCIPLSDPNAYIGVSDMVTFRNNVGDLYGLVLERLSTERCSGLVSDARVYLVDLNRDSGEDVKGCDSLSDINCMNIEAIDKDLMFTFSTDIKSDATLQQMLNYLNFEILSVIYNDDGSVYDENNIINLVAVNDNSDIGQTNFDTYFIYFSIDVSSIMEQDTDTIIDCTTLTTETECEQYPEICDWEEDDYEESCLPSYTTTDDSEEDPDAANSVFTMVGIMCALITMLICN